MDRLTLSEAFPGVSLTPKGDGSGRYRALLIREGWGSCGYYSREVLERDGPRCWPAGTQQYLNHPTLTEQHEQPERRVQDWASKIVTTPVWDEAERGLVAEVQVFPQWRELLNPEFASEVGLSIRAYGAAEHGEAEGREGPIIQRLTEGISVDWVTRAGAGGRVLELIESAREHTGGPEAEADPAELWEAKYSADQLKAMLAKGQAMRNANGDPSYPIADEEDLRRAIKAVGRGGRDHDKIRSYIVRRAKALGKSGLIPADWKSTSPKESAHSVAEELELDEAGRTIGGRLEARIHTAFAVMADDMYADGRLTRDERIALSNAFGSALKAFVDQVEADAPQLYQRDPWAYPPDEDDGDGTVTEAGKSGMAPPFQPKKNADDPDSKPDDEDPEKAKAKTARGGKPAPNEKKEGAMPEITDEQAKQLDEAAATKTRLDEAIANLEKATTTIEAQGQKIQTLEAKLDAADKRGQARDNADRARVLCDEAFGTSGLPGQAKPRIIRSVLRDLPVDDNGWLDETKLGEAIKTSIQDEKTYVAELDEARGWGVPRGLGGDTGPVDNGDDDLEKDLAESFAAMGMDDAEAKVAARGR